MRMSSWVLCVFLSIACSIFGVFINEKFYLRPALGLMLLVTIAWPPLCDFEGVCEDPIILRSMLSKVP